MILEIITPVATLFKGPVDRLSLPGEEGIFDILPHHVSLIASLREGEIRYESGKKREAIAIKNGFVDVNNDHISICIEQS